jgi:hypothetical protein
MNSGEGLLSAFMRLPQLKALAAGYPGWKGVAVAGGVCWSGAHVGGGAAPG